MLNEKVGSLLNVQINKEFYSAYLYLEFSNFYKEKGLDGYANWYQIQAKEEMDHALLIMQYLQNNDYKVVFETVNQPKAELKNFDDPLKEGLEHERYVTGLINNIYGAAHDAKDYRTVKFLDWFVDEQGEEEKTAMDMITKYELFGHDPKGLYSLDSEYKARVCTAPSLVLE